MIICVTGDFSYSKGSSGWTDTSIGSQGWVLHLNSTAKGTDGHRSLVYSHFSHETTKLINTCLFFWAEEYLYVAEAPGQQLTEAQTRTPLLGPSGPACTLQFDFALTGNPAHIGTLMNGSH